MEQTFGDRLKHAWDAFRNKNPTPSFSNIGAGYSYRPDRPRFSRGNEKSIVTSIFNRIALDVAAIDIRHVRLDDNGRFSYCMKSRLDDCLTTEANLDQTARAFRQDIVMSMLDEGCVAIVPVEADDEPTEDGRFEVYSMRTAKIVEWYPQHVRVRVYNDKTGQKEDLVLPKKTVSIIENPLYAVVNESNSTLKRLIRKLNLLDAIDEQSSSGKLDLIIQLPYTVKTETKRQQAEKRRSDIESQLVGSKYGIAYADATERITQLNRPVGNNLMTQIEFLTNMLYGQLGITQSVMDSSAKEEEMVNYNSRTIEPIVSAIVDEMRRKFLTKAARSRGQSIMFFKDPFKLASLSAIAEVGDKLTRNEIMSSNEIRQKIGLPPVNDPRADELRNKNLNATGDPMPMTDDNGDAMTQEEYDSYMADLDELDEGIDELEQMLDEDESLKHYASPYYDPAKAHQYYEEHKKLKGRTSTAGLNEEGRKVASYVKSQITAEKKQRLTANTESRKSQIESKREARRQAVEAHKTEMNQKIDTLRTMLKNMSKEDRKANKERVQGLIADLRSENKAKREELTAQFKADSANITVTSKANAEGIRKDADDRYASELAKIKSEEKYQAKKKGTKSSSSKSGKSGSKVSQEQLDAFIKANKAALKK